IVGAGAGGVPYVKVIDGTKISQVQADGQIATSALLGGFLAFDPTFSGGVSVASGDVNHDNRNEVLAGAAPGGVPHVKVIAGTNLSQVQADGQIALSALRASFFPTDPNFSGGVFIASDADHRDGPIFGPPGITITNSRHDINDMFLFRSPANAANSVL